MSQDIDDPAYWLDYYTRRERSTMLRWFEFAVREEWRNKAYGASYRWHKYVDYMELAFEEWQEAEAKLTAYLEHQ